MEGRISALRVFDFLMADDLAPQSRGELLRLSFFLSLFHLLIIVCAAVDGMRSAQQRGGGSQQQQPADAVVVEGTFAYSRLKEEAGGGGVKITRITVQPADGSADSEKLLSGKTGGSQRSDDGDKQSKKEEDQALALSSLNVHVPRGAFVGVVGSVGSGKSKRSSASLFTLWLCSCRFAAACDAGRAVAGGRCHAIQPARLCRLRVSGSL